MSASSWFVTWGIVVHEFVRYFDDNFFTLGMSLISISPKSECSNSFLILSGLLSFTTTLFFELDETNFLISSSTTLPSFWLPATWLISTPSSLANFLAFGLADEISEILFLENVFSWISGFITSIFFDSFSISWFFFNLFYF